MASIFLGHWSGPTVRQRLTLPAVWALPQDVQDVQDFLAGLRADLPPPRDFLPGELGWAAKLISRAAQ